MRALALILVAIATLTCEVVPLSAQIQESGPMPRGGEMEPNPPDGGGDGGDADEILIRSHPAPLDPIGLRGMAAEHGGWIVRLMVWLGTGR
jgi:hypothetical protein